MNCIWKKNVPWGKRKERKMGGHAGRIWRRIMNYLNEENTSLARPGADGQEKLQPLFIKIFYINLKLYNNRTWLQDDTTRRTRIHYSPVALTN